MSVKVDRPYRISGYPVSKQELLDQAEIICGHPVHSVGMAKRIIEADGRDVDLT